MINCEVLPNGSLKISADNATRRDIKEAYAAHRDFWSILSKLFEPYFTNGSYEPFDAGQGNPFVGLTSAPCIAESMNHLDDGTCEIEGRLWFYQNYMLTDPLEELKNTGRVIFQGGDNA